MNSEEALKILILGNIRYAAGEPSIMNVSAEFRSELLKEGQHPFAAIVGCSDSRVPMELIFDAGLGELFVIRTAGNVVGDIELGSLEYAVEVLKTPLIAVIGHQECGAVKEAIHGGKFSKSMRVLIDEICRCSDGDICTCNQEEIEDKNILHTLSKIALNPIISKAVEEGKLRLAAGKYSMETGLVSFFK